MNIVLIGYRGTGKTTVARLLALHLGWDWADSDVEIELRAGRSIAAIFADQGEAAFRELEVQVVAELAGREKTVLALGGGAVVHASTRQLLLQYAALRRASIVWLSAGAETLWQRIAADAVTAERRPNLTTRGGITEITELLGKRAPIYRQCAALEVDTEGKTPADVAAEILARLQLDHA